MRKPKFEARALILQPSKLKQRASNRFKKSAAINLIFSRLRCRTKLDKGMKPQMNTDRFGFNPCLSVFICGFNFFNINLSDYLSLIRARFSIEQFLRQIYIQSDRCFQIFFQHKLVFRMRDENRTCAQQKRRSPI